MVNQRLAWFLLSSIVFLFSINTAASQALSAGKESKTHLVIITVCPPWKEKQINSLVNKSHNNQYLNANSSCVNVANKIGITLAKRYDVAPDSIFYAVNNTATYDNISQIFKTLKAQSKPDDKLVVYVVAHGGIFNLQGDDKEMLFLWSQQFPSQFLNAYLDKTALEVKDLAQAIHAVPAQEKLLVIDSCHSALSFKDIKDENNNLTLITSTSRINKSADFTADFKYPLFSKVFTDYLAQEQNQLISQFFDNLKNEVRLKASELCKKNNYLAKVGNCTQEPSLFPSQNPNKW